MLISVTVSSSKSGCFRLSIAGVMKRCSLMKNITRHPIYNTGAENFPAAPFVLKIRAPGEIDVNGSTVHQVSIVPKP